MRILTLFISMLFVAMIGYRADAQLSMIFDFFGSNGKYPLFTGFISDGTYLYGTTSEGGSGNGNVFKIRISDNTYTQLLDIGSVGGRLANGSLYFDGVYLYGTTREGGNKGAGMIFKIKPDGSAYSKVFDFSQSYGDYPQCALVSDGTYLYGSTSVGGDNGYGTIFKIKKDGSEAIILHHFGNNENSIYPEGTLYFDGTYLYGMIAGEMPSRNGSIYKIKTDGTGYAKIYNFDNTNGSVPNGSLISDGTYLYGMTEYGGTNNAGVIFKINISNNAVTKLFDFSTNANGINPKASLTTDGIYLYGLTPSGGSSNNGVLFKIKKDGTQYSVLNNFDGSNGSKPNGTPFYCGKTLYGMTKFGGSSNYGAVFQYTLPQSGNALNFNGTNNNVDLGNSFVLTTDFTIEAWIKPNSKAGYSAIIANKYGGCTDPGFGLVLNNWETTDGALNLEMNGCFAFATPAGAITFGEWQHVAVVVSSTTGCKLYVNGIEKAANGTTSIPAGSGHLVLGSFAGGDAYNFDGNIDEVRIWNTVRQQSDIQSSMYSSLVGNETGLTGYYKFDEGVSCGNNSIITTLANATANNLNGTLNSFALNGSCVSNWISSYAMLKPVATKATNVFTTYFTANWTAPTTGVEPTNYYIDVATDAAFTAMVTGWTNVSVGSATTSININSNITFPNTYYYRVRAEAANGISANSNTISVVTKFTKPTAGILYVTPFGAGAKDGSSWANAFDGANFYENKSKLIYAINNSESGDQIWVANGTYYPTDNSDRTISFIMKENVKIYGGFNGNETALNQRNIKNNETILSGDIGVVGNNSDNTYQVLNCSSLYSSETLLDGFTITKGYANESDMNGAGIYINDSGTSFANCKIVSNATAYAGGGIYMVNSSPGFSNCTISYNNADQGGGVDMYGYSLPTFVNCKISGNYASRFGGGIDIGDGLMNLTNCLISDNYAGIYGGGMFFFFYSESISNFINCTITNNGGSSGGGLFIESVNGDLVADFKNSIIWNNNDNGGRGTANANIANAGNSRFSYSLIQNITTSANNNLNGFTNAGNTNYPGFYNPASADFRLMTGSVCLNIGNNSANSTTKDIEGNNRILYTTIDLGAYEYYVPAPVAIRADNFTTTGFTARWNALPGVTNYRLDVSADINFGSFVDGYENITVTGSGQAISGLSAGTAYFYRLRADAANGISANSNTIAAIPLMTAPGNALSFNGSNTTVDLGNSINLTSDFTIESWFKPEANTTYSTIISNKTGGCGTTGFSLFVKQDGAIAIEYGDCGGFSSLANVVQFNKWQHVAYTVSLVNGSKIYLNGNEVASGAATSNSAGALNLRLGDYANALGWYPFKGNLDELRIWNTALAPAQLQTNMYQPLTLPYSSNLVSYYNFDCTSKNILYDLKGTNNGTLVNSPVWTESYAMVVPTATTASNVSFTSFDANWTTPVTGTVENYMIDVATDAAFTLPVTGSPFSVASPALTKSVTNLTLNTTYYYRVRADKTSVTGEGTYSNVLSVTTQVLNPTAGILYVTPTGEGLKDGSSWTNALDGASYENNSSKLQYAISNSASGTQIWVAAGTYKPCNNGDRYISFNLKEGVSVYGGFFGNETLLTQRDWKTHETILSGDIGTVGDNSDNSYHVIKNENDNLTAASLLDGFTIRDGNASNTGINSNGAGIYIDNSSPTISNCKVIGNNASGNAGIFLESSNSLVINTIISGNNGNGMNCEYGSPTIINCLISGNYRAALSGSGLYIDGCEYLKLINTTISGNKTLSWGNALYAIVLGYTTLEIDNCIIWNNQNQGGIGIASANYIVENHGGTINIKNSLIQNVTTADANGNLNGFEYATNNNYPNFVTPIDLTTATLPTADGDFNLENTSPCLNVGNTSLNTTTTDLANNTRLVNWAIDLGAYENQTLLAPIAPVATAATGISNSGFTANWNSLTGATGYYLDVATDNTFSLLVINNSDVGNLTSYSVTSLNTGTTYYYRVRAYNTIGTSVSSNTITTQTIPVLNPTANILYVTPNGAGLNDGSSWTNAFDGANFYSNGSKLNYAIQNVASGTQIWVAAGTYYPCNNGDRTVSFSLKEGVNVYGGFFGNETLLTQRDWKTHETILSGDIGTVSDNSDNSYHIIKNENDNLTAACLLDGFTIIDGNADGTGFNGSGGGILNRRSSPTIGNCKVITNNAFGGGGIFLSDSNSPVINTIISGNTGGGMTSVGGSPTIINCLISGNYSENVGLGLQIGTFRHIKLINTTISGNKSSIWGSALYVRLISGDILEIDNCIIWNNQNQNGIGKASANYDVYYTNGTINIKNSLIQNRTTADANGNLDGFTNAANYNYPRFVAPIDLTTPTIPTTAGDFGLLPGSIGFNAGNNTFNTETYDLAGNPRINNTTIDLGPYEYQAMTAPGNALSFNPANTNTVNCSSILNAATAFTIEAWIKPEANSGPNTIVASKNTGCTTGGFAMYVNAFGTENNALVVETDNCGTLYTLGGAIKMGQWQHVAIVVNSFTSAKLYINGVEQTTYGSFTMTSLSAPLTLGDFSGGGSHFYFKGSMDEVRIWNSALSTGEIQTNLYQPVALPNTKLISYYQFDQTSGNTLYDLTSNANNGSIVNPNWTESYAMVVPIPQAADNILNSGFTAHWAAPAVGTVTKYLLDVSTSSDFGSFVSGYNSKDCGTNLSQTITNLSGGTTYYYRVRADKNSVTDQGGFYRNAVSVTTLKTTQSITFSPISSPVINGVLPITLTATASSGLNVSFASDNEAVATVSGNILTVVGAGVVNITASQSGNSAYFAASDVVHAIEVLPNMTTPGNALTFNGSSAYVTVPYNFSGFTTYTIEAWIKPSSLVNQTVIAANNGSGFTTAHQINIFNGKFQHYTYDGTTININGTTDILVDKWYHVAITATNGGMARLFVNGVEEGTPLPVGTLETSGTQFYIGRSGFGGAYFNGSVDEVRFWNFEKDGTAIQTSMYNVVNPATTGLVSYYRFDQTSGNTLYDLTSNANHGTILNANWTESYAMVQPIATAATDISPVGFTANWTVPAKGNTPTNYFIDVATDAAFTAMVSGWNNHGVGSAATSLIVNSGLSASTTYYYRVRAYKNTATGLSTNSNTISAQTRALPSISGNAGVAGATLSYTDGTAKTATADGSGAYSFTVSNGWTGTVTPGKAGYTFTPASANYTNVTSDQTMQNFTTVGTYTWTGTLSTDWNTEGNWNPAHVPTATEDAVIPDRANDPVVNEATATPAVCRNMLIESGAVVTIAAGKVLIVNGTLTNNAGISGLVVQSTSDAANGTGALLNGTAGVLGTVERYVSGDLWHLISPAATAGETVANFVDLANGNLVARNGTNYALAPWLESTGKWDYYKVSGSNTSGQFGTPAKGFQVMRANGAGSGTGTDVASGGKLTFKGTLAAADQNIDLTKSSSGYGWNLIGNPYPCALDIAKFIEPNTSNTTQLDPSFLAIYVSNIADVAAKGYNPVFAADGLKLAPGEGFFVRTKTGGGSISFTTAMKSSVSAAFKAATVDIPTIQLTVEDGKGYWATIIKYEGGATKGLDPGKDAGLFNGTASSFSLFTRLVEDNGVDFTVQALPDNNLESMVVPVGLVAAKGATVTFKATAANLPAGYEVVLEDKETATFTRLDKANSTYTVSLNTANSGTGRFYLHTNEIISAIDKALLSEIKVVPMPEHHLVRIIGNFDLPAKAMIYDMNGKLVATRMLTSQIENDIPLTNSVTGVYLLKMESGKGVETVKFVWKRK